MEHKNGTVAGDCAVTRRLKVTGQNVRLADPVVGEETIGRFGVGPVLADQRNALAHGAPDLRHQLAQPLVQALVGETAASKFVIKPRIGSPGHWHRSPCESVPEKESRSIPATQQFVPFLSSLSKCG